MAYYYKRKEIAKEEGEFLFGEHWEVRTELEPFNGWVIVLYPKTPDALKQDLTDILTKAEIQVGRLRQRPPEYRKPPTVAKKAAPKPKAPPRPAAPPPKPPMPPAAPKATPRPPLAPPPPPKGT